MKDRPAWLYALAILAIVLFIGPLRFVTVGLRDQKALSESSVGVLGLGRELRAEAATSEFALDQARRDHAAILSLYIRTLDRRDVLSILKLSATSQLREHLILIARDLESDPDPASGIARAADRVHELYEKLDVFSSQLPTIGRDKDGAVHMAVTALCRSTELFEHTMMAQNGPGLRKADICELACLDSRRAFLAMLCLWNEQTDPERATIIQPFVHCLEKTLNMTRSLAEELEETEPATAATLRQYAESMERRLKTIAAMSAGNRDEAIRLLKEPSRKPPVTPIAQPA